MKRNLIIILLSITTFLNANSAEQTQFMRKIADKSNAKTNNLRDLPRRTTHISNVTVEENYTLNISLKTHFVDKNQIANFRNINKIKMKQNLTYFELDEENCRKAKLVFNSVKHNSF